jgi:hypothetical protein
MQHTPIPSFYFTRSLGAPNNNNAYIASLSVSLPQSENNKSAREHLSSAAAACVHL